MNLNHQNMRNRQLDDAPGVELGSATDEAVMRRRGKVGVSLEVRYEQKRWLL